MKRWRRLSRIQLYGQTQPDWVTKERLFLGRSRSGERVERCGSRQWGDGDGDDDDGGDDGDNGREYFATVNICKLVMSSVKEWVGL